MIALFCKPFSSSAKLNPCLRNKKFLSGWRVGGAHYFKFLIIDYKITNLNLHLQHWSPTMRRRTARVRPVSAAGSSPSRPPPKYRFLSCVILLPGESDWISWCWTFKIWKHLNLTYFALTFLYKIICILFFTNFMFIYTNDIIWPNIKHFSTLCLHSSLILLDSRLYPVQEICHLRIHTCRIQYKFLNVHSCTYNKISCTLYSKSQHKTI